jgi:hypothetical protein
VRNRSLITGCEAIYVYVLSTSRAERFYELSDNMSGLTVWCHLLLRRVWSTFTVARYMYGLVTTEIELIKLTAESDTFTAAQSKAFYLTAQRGNQIQDDA